VRCRTGTLRPFDGIRNLKKIKAKKDPKYFAICRVVCWFVPTDHGDRVFLLMLFGWKWMLILTMNCPFKIILNIPVTSLERYLDVGKICNRHLKKNGGSFRRLLQASHHHNIGGFLQRDKSQNYNNKQQR
jgi:hypothetical protein